MANFLHLMRSSPLCRVIAALTSCGVPNPPSLVDRLLKEVAYYKQEVKDNETKLEEMKNGNKDPYDIKQFEKVLAESYMMVPDSEKRLALALEDLHSFMNNNSEDGQPDTSKAVDKKGEWYRTADNLLRENFSSGIGDNDQEAAVTNVDDLADGEAF